MPTQPDRRLELHEELCGLLGTRYAYFQPPPTVQLHYPCFVYDRSNSNDLAADDKSRYLHRQGYSLTYIAFDPDDPMADQVVEHFQYCRWSRHYTADNLHHDVFTLYY